MLGISSECDERFMLGISSEREVRAVLGISSGSAAARKPREFRVVLGDMEAA